MTKEFIKSLIISSLGGSQTKVELTDDDLEFIIYQSINYYTYYSSEGLNEELRIIRLKANTNEHQIPDDIEYIIWANLENGGLGIQIIPFTFSMSYEIAMLGGIVNDNQIQRITNPVFSKIIYKDGKRYIQTDLKPQQDTNIACKVLTYKDLSILYNTPWIQNYAIALAKMTLGLIRSKFGSISANGSDLISQSQQEKEKLENELYEMGVIYSGGIIIG